MFRPALPAAACALALLLAGCGYMGETLPPALRRPVPVTDLTAVEHGSKIEIRFTVPKVTTEGLPVVGSPDMDLRIGPAETGFQPASWVATSHRIADISLEKGVALASVDASGYVGRRVVAGVNVYGPRQRTAGWSNFVAVTVVPPLAQPAAFAAKDGPDDVLLSWAGSAPEFRVFRKTPEESVWARIGTATGTLYADSTIEYGRTYEYYVQAQQKAGEGYAESEASEVITFKPADRFPPATPSGLTVVPGIRTMELVWDRNSEKDFGSYRIYRNGKLLQTVTYPAYSDRDVAPGTRYEYQISSVDLSGNESAKCAAVAAAIP